MRSSPIPIPSLSPSLGRRCHFYRGPLGQPDTVRTRTVSDARHASDTALPRAADTRRTLSDTVGHRRVSAAQYPTRVGRPTLFGPALCRVALCSVSHGSLSTESAPFYRMAWFLEIPRKRRFLKSAEYIYDVRHEIYIYIENSCH